MKLVGYQQPTCLCVKMEFVVGTISISCELFHFLKPEPTLRRCSCIGSHDSGVPAPWRSDRLFIFAR